MRTNKADLRKAVIILGGATLVSLAIVVVYVCFGLVKLENLV
jgi:hypothetical protein